MAGSFRCNEPPTILGDYTKIYVLYRRSLLVIANAGKVGEAGGGRGAKRFSKRY